MSNLIRDFNDKQQKQYASNLEVPKVTAPALQDAAPVADSQMQVTTPQASSLEQLTAPIADKELGITPQYDVTAEFNNRLSRQLPTLLYGQPSDAERKSMEYYDWVGSQIEENRKRNAAQAITLPSLTQYNTPTKTRPNGFGSNVLKGLFGDTKTNTSDDGILGNEFDISKGRFGQYGGGVVGGAMYLLDNTLGLGILRNSLMDTAANLSSQAAGWAASGGVFDTLFKSGDVGKAIAAGSNRQKQALRNIYGDDPTSFLKQGLMGRDLGALGNLSGDSNDDYKKLYGSSPAAAGLDRAFFGRSLTEQESKDYEKLTGYGVKELLNNASGGTQFKFTPEEEKEYGEIMGRVPEDFKTKMLLRNLVGLAADIKTDDALKPLINLKPQTPKVDVEIPQLSGAPDRVMREGSSPTQRRLPLPPKERNTTAADEYIGNWLRRGETVETKPVGTIGDLPGRGNDPWVTVDATAVRVPEALSGSPRRAALPTATSPTRTLTTPSVLPTSGVTRSALPTQEIVDDIVRAGRETLNNPLSVTDAVMKELRASTSKSFVVSPPLAQVVTPQQADVASVLRQQYMTRVEPGQYVLQRLGTIADTDPLIALKASEPAPRIQNPVQLALPPAVVAPPISLKRLFAGSDTAENIRSNYSFIKEDAEVQAQIRSELLFPQSEIKETPRSPLPETRSELPISDAKKTVENTSPLKEPETTSEVPSKIIPTSKAEILKAARERLEATKREQRGEVAPPKDETIPKEKEAAPKEDVVKEMKSESPKEQMLRQARENLEKQKAERRLQSAVSEGFAKPVEGNAEVRVDVESPKGQELLNDAIDFDELFNKTYDVSDLDTMISMVSRASAGAPISFVGKVAPIAEVSRSQKEIYRFGSLVPHPSKPGKPLLPPTKSMVAEYQARYGVDHPYASSAIADSSMKYLTKNGGARRHKSLDDLSQEQVNPLYRKILSPGGTPIPLAVIEKFEKQLSEGGQALVKTSSDTVSVIDTAPPIAAQSPSVVRTRGDAQKFIDDNKLGIKKNLSADKLNEYLALYESKGIDAVPDEAFTKAGLSARNSLKEAAAQDTEVKQTKRVKKVEQRAKEVIATETLDDFEEAVVKLEDLEPTIKELEAIEQKISKAPIYDHRKKLTSPAHTPEVVKEIAKTPELIEKQKVHDELVAEIAEVVTQEQELYKVKQAIDVAVDSVDAQYQARVKKLMEKYGLPRAEAAEFDESLQAMLARNGEAFPLIDEKGWTRSRKAAFKGLAQSLLNVDDMKTSPNYEQLRQGVIDSGEYEKAAAWLYQNSGTKKATNPVISIDADGNFDFTSGSSTFFAAMDSGLDQIPVQIISDQRLASKGIEWTKHPLAKGERVEMSVADLDSRWKTDRVEAGGEGGIGTRYESAREFMKANDKINMSEVVVKPDGSVVFKDGRHRFAVLRDEGVGVISVMAENPQYLIPGNVVKSQNETVINARMSKPESSMTLVEKMRHNRTASDKDVIPMTTEELKTAREQEWKESPEYAKQQEANSKYQAEVAERLAAFSAERRGKANPIEVVKELDAIPQEVKQLPATNTKPDVELKTATLADALSSRQAEAVRRYTEIAKSNQGRENYYRGINEYLRTGETLPGFTQSDLNATIANLDAALEVLPKHKGDVVRVVSPSTLPSDLKPGDVLRDKGYLSTIPKEDYDEGREVWSPIGGSRGRVEIRIKNANGALLGGYSEHGMIEALLGRNTAIEVTKVKRVGGVPKVVEGVVKAEGVDEAPVVRSPLQVEALEKIKTLDAQLQTGNYLPIYELRKAMPDVSRSTLDETLYALERENKIELSSLVEGSRYTREQYDLGIKQRTGAPLFFVKVIDDSVARPASTPSAKAVDVELPQGSYSSKSANEDLLATSVLGTISSLTEKETKRFAPLMSNGALNADNLEAFLIDKATRSISSIFVLNEWSKITNFLAANSSNPSRDFRTLADSFKKIMSKKNNPFLEGAIAMFATPAAGTKMFKDSVKKVSEALENSAVVAETIKTTKDGDIPFVARVSGETTPNGISLDAVAQTMRVEDNALKFKNTNAELPVVSTSSKEAFIEAFKNLTLETLPNRNLETDGSIKLLQLFGVKADEKQGFDGRWLDIRKLQTASGDVIFTPYRNGGSLYRFINAYLRSGIEGVADMVESYNLEAMVLKGKGAAGEIKWNDEGLRRATIDAIYYIPMLRRAVSEMPVYDAALYKTDPLMQSRLLNPQAPTKITTRKDYKLVRGLPHKFVAQLKKGDTFVDEAFISTTINYEHAVNFAKSMLGNSVANPEQGAIIVFNTSKNAHITPNRLENEVLFAPGNKFVVDDVKMEKGLPTYYVSQINALDDTLGVDTKYINLESGESFAPSIQREPLSRQNISDAVRFADREFDAASLRGQGLNPALNLPPLKVSRSAPLTPGTIGQAVNNFKDALRKINKTGEMDADSQIALNNSVLALETLKDKTYANKMREVVARLSGRSVDEGKPFMSAAVEMLNDGKPRSRDEIADILSYAIGTKDVKFAQNLTDDEVLKFGRLIAQRPETFSQFDHLYVGHGTGVVEHGTWSLEARPSTGYKSRDLVQHIVDNTYPKGTEVGVAACETGCPKRIQDAVPPLHRVVSRGAVQGAMENMQRLIEGLSSMPTTPKVMDVLAEYDGLLREALTANKQRGTEILQKMSALEDEFNDITKRNKFANEQRTRAKIKQAQASIEKDLLGDC